MAGVVGIEIRLAEVRERISAACRSAGRDPEEVVLIAVSKTFGADAVAAVLAAGATDLGENRAQEFKEKRAAIGSGARWHFIGHLQTNKVRHVVGRATLLHSVDRFALAEAVARRARSLNLEQDVLIEVNIAGEASKQGVATPAALDLAQRVDELQGITVRGLMSVPPRPERPDDSRPYYRELATLSTSLQDRLPRARFLSMGMTGDLEVAIEEGATHVRVGEAIFGPRR